jgi:hypothetical protein
MQNEAGLTSTSQGLHLKLSQRNGGLRNPRLELGRVRNLHANNCTNNPGATMSAKLG